MDLVVARGSQVGVTESHRWEAPELFAANQNYPWPLKTTLSIANPIEEYQQVQITTRHGENYASTTIYPLAMKSIDHLVETRVWKVEYEGLLSYYDIQTLKCIGQNWINLLKLLLSSSSADGTKDVSSIVLCLLNLYDCGQIRKDFIGVIIANI